jgi:hypothetical protein
MTLVKFIVLVCLWENGGSSAAISPPPHHHDCGPGDLMMTTQRSKKLL